MCRQHADQTNVAAWQTERRRHRLSLAALVLLVSIATLCAPAGEGLADIFRYDPSQCSTDAGGAVTVALDRTILRLPIDDLLHDDKAPEPKPTRARPVEAPAPPKDVDSSVIDSLLGDSNDDSDDDKPTN